jgi:hypothetical protein
MNVFVKLGKWVKGDIGNECFKIWVVYKRRGVV